MTRAIEFVGGLIVLGVVAVLVAGRMALAAAGLVAQAAVPAGPN